jgi:DNA segregation ATPase FtsK/SpoIIIE, S-DNA-T family
MAARKKKRPLRPRTPSRVKKRTTKKRARARAAHEHPELIGLGLAAVGLFLATLLYFGWEGGVAGEKIEAGLRDVIGSAAYAAPLALVIVGCLMLFRSALLDVKPFRTGLVVTIVGLMVTLGEEHGGAVGNVLGGGAARRHRLRPARPDRAARRRAHALWRVVRRPAPSLAPCRPPGGRPAGESV